VLEFEKQTGLVSDEKPGVLMKNPCGLGFFKP